MLINLMPVHAIHAAVSDTQERNSRSGKNKKGPQPRAWASYHILWHTIQLLEKLVSMVPRHLLLEGKDSEGN